MPKEKIGAPESEPPLSEKPPGSGHVRQKKKRTEMIDRAEYSDEDRAAYEAARDRLLKLTARQETATEEEKTSTAERLWKVAEQARQAAQEVKKKEYTAKHLPNYLKGKQGKPSFLSGVFNWMMRIKEMIGKVKVRGRENIPQQGPYLVVSNHSGGETAALYGVFDKQPLRVTSGEELNWKRSGFRAWLLRRLGMIPVRESLSNLSAVEKASLLQRVPGQVRKEAYGRIVESDNRGELRSNLKYIRSTVAALLQGDVVAVFPEGLFLYDGKRSLRKAYGGIELIAREYKRVSGKELPILPFSISQKTIGIGEGVSFSDNKTMAKDSDWIMAHVAKELPPEERGVYAELAEEITSNS